MFVSALESEGLDYADGGCQVAHADLTWSLSLVVDGAGALAPYRIVLGASSSQLGMEAPRNAEDCYLVLPLPYAGGNAVHGVPRMVDAVFPEWPGTDAARAAAIAGVVGTAVRYVRQIDTLHELRGRHVLGHFDSALIVAPMHRLLIESS